MAPSPLRSKSQYHTRSLSLPSQSYPLITQFNDHLSKLNESDNGSSSSLPSISNRISGLEDLYECVDELLLQRYSQQAIAHGQWVDEALDGYLSLLDAFSKAKDIFSQTKDQVKQLLSSIRRNRDESNFQSYLAYRKKAIKTIRKLLKDLKSIGNNEMNPKMGQDLETVAIVSMLKEAQVVTVSVLESLLSCAAGTKTQSRSLVSKLLQKKTAAKETVISEFEKIDIAMISSKDTETLPSQLKKLELSIESVEEVLERLNRRLIKTRVSLLNILDHWSMKFSLENRCL